MNNKKYLEELLNLKEKGAELFGDTLYIKNDLEDSKGEMVSIDELIAELKARITREKRNEETIRVLNEDQGLNIKMHMVKSIELKEEQATKKVYGVDYDYIKSVLQITLRDNQKLKLDVETFDRKRAK